MKFGNGNLIVLQTHLHRIPTWARWASSAPSDGHSRLCGWPNRCSPAPSVPWPSRCHVWNVGRHNLYKPPKRKTNMRIGVRNMDLMADFYTSCLLVNSLSEKKMLGWWKGDISNQYMDLSPWNTIIISPLYPHACHYISDLVGLYNQYI
jgi:hypothetical protein